MPLTFALYLFQPGKPIFSLDIHPDGSRFVTGGQGNERDVEEILI